MNYENLFKLLEYRIKHLIEYGEVCFLINLVVEGFDNLLLRIDYMGYSKLFMKYVSIEILTDYLINIYCL